MSGHHIFIGLLAGLKVKFKVKVRVGFRLRVRVRIKRLASVLYQSPRKDVCVAWVDFQLKCIHNNKYLVYFTLAAP